MSNDYELMEHEATSLFDTASGYKVETDEQYSEVGEFVMGCKTMIAKIKEAFKEPKRKTDEAHKAITSMEKRMLQPVEDAIAIASRVALDYKREQDRLAKEEKQIWMQETGQIEGRPTKFQSPVPKVDGLSTRMTWKAEVLFPEQVKPRYCKPDMPFINLMVKNFMAMYANPTPEQIAEAEAKIGGIRIYAEESFAGRTR